MSEVERFIWELNDGEINLQEYIPLVKIRKGVIKGKTQLIISKAEFFEACKKYTKNDTLYEVPFWKEVRNLLGSAFVEGRPTLNNKRTFCISAEWIDPCCFGEVEERQVNKIPTQTFKPAKLASNVRGNITVIAPPRIRTPEPRKPVRVTRKSSAKKVFKTYQQDYKTEHTINITFNNLPSQKSTCVVIKNNEGVHAEILTQPCDKTKVEEDIQIEDKPELPVSQLDIIWNNQVYQQIMATIETRLPLTLPKLDIALMYELYLCNQV